MNLRIGRRADDCQLWLEMEGSNVILCSRFGEQTYDECTIMPDGTIAPHLESNFEWRGLSELTTSDRETIVKILGNVADHDTLRPLLERLVPSKERRHEIYKSDTFKVSGRLYIDQ